MAELGPITFVIDGAVDQPTGGYLYDERVIDGLRARGEEVEIVSLDASSVLTSARSNVSFARVLERAEMTSGLVIADELCHPRVAAPALLAKLVRRRSRLVTLVHHLAASEREGLSAHARRLVERCLLVASDGIIVTSKTTRAAVIAAGAQPSRVRVALPGRDRLGSRSAPPLRAAGTPLRFLFVGTLTARKGVLELLEAFASLGDPSTLTIAGPVDRDPRYAAKASTAAAKLGDRVRVLGTASDADLSRALSEHDVLVLPSRYEGFGIVVAEAANHGLAIVATRVGAIPEVIGDAAILVPPGDVRALGAALGSLTADPTRVDSLKRAALARAAELPTWKETEAAFRDSLVSLVSLDSRRRARASSAG